MDPDLLPYTWNYGMEKESLKRKELEHIQIEKIDHFFWDMLVPFQGLTPRSLPFFNASHQHLRGCGAKLHLSRILAINFRLTSFAFAQMQHSLDSFKQG